MNDPTYFGTLNRVSRVKNLVSLLFCCFGMNSYSLCLLSLVDSYLPKYFGGTVQFHLSLFGANIILKGRYLSFWLLNFLTYTSNLQEAVSCLMGLLILININFRCYGPAPTHFPSGLGFHHLGVCLSLPLTFVHAVCFLLMYCCFTVRDRLERKLFGLSQWMSITF